MARRSVNVDTSIIEALKARSEELGLKGHTGVASMIFIGSTPPVSLNGERDGKVKGVSMRESMWLAIKVRAEKLELPVTQATEKILLGEVPFLTKKEIDEGEQICGEREKARESKAKEREEQAKAQFPALRDESKADPLGVAQDPAAQISTLKSGWRYFLRRFNSTGPAQKALREWVDVFESTIELGVVPIEDLLQFSENLKEALIASSSIPRSEQILRIMKKLSIEMSKPDADPKQDPIPERLPESKPEPINIPEETPEEIEERRRRRLRLSKGEPAGSLFESSGALKDISLAEEDGYVGGVYSL